MFQDTEEIRSLRPIKYFRLTEESKIKRLTNRQMKSGQAASVLTGFRIPYHSVSYMKLCNRFFFFLFHSILVLFLLTKEKLLRSRCAPSFCTRSSSGTASPTPPQDLQMWIYKVFHTDNLACQDCSFSLVLTFYSYLILILFQVLNNYFILNVFIRHRKSCMKQRGLWTNKIIPKQFQLLHSLPFLFLSRTLPHF